MTKIPRDDQQDEIPPDLVRLVRVKVLATKELSGNYHVESIRRAAYLPDLGDMRL